MHLLCENKVKDYAAWREIFDGDAEAHRRAGLHLEHIWLDQKDADSVFLFEVDSLERAKAFIEAPEAKAKAEQSGVMDGTYRFLDAQPGYC